VGDIFPGRSLKSWTPFEGLRMAFVRDCAFEKNILLYNNVPPTGNLIMRRKTVRSDVYAMTVTFILRIKYI